MKYSMRDEKAVLQVIDHCLELERLALGIYESWRASAKDPRLRDLWEALAADERGHEAYWLRLKEVSSEGGVPEVFDEPWRYVDELQALRVRVEHLSSVARLEPDPPRVFIHALKLEFLLLHPAIVTLFHSLPESRDDGSPTRTYGLHLGKLLGALMDYGELAPELDLLGEAIGQVWKKSEESAARAVRDQLTGALNRRGLYVALKPLAHLARREQRAAGVLLLELTNLRAINREHNYRVGDDVLAAVAAAIGGRLRASDVVGRFGGDDFLAFLTRFEPAQFAAIGAEIAERVAALEVAGVRPVPAVGGAYIARVTSAVTDAESLIRAADRALGKARAGTESCVVVEVP